jgi:uncharacterized protein YxeA
MKKVIYIIATALLLASCCSNTTYETSHIDGTKEYVYINFKEQVSKKSLTVYRYEYDGHKYILFGDSEYNNGVVHDPDCPCHTVEAPSKTETSDYPDWW